MTDVNPRKRKRDAPHPYLSGNFAPLKSTQPPTPCSYTGTIPPELYGGEYVRNGGNPVTNEDLGRDAHWFDGDGMLSGVAFRRTEKGVRPEFVNQFILTDLYLASISSSALKIPLLPSIATLIDPFSSLLCIVGRILRALLLVFLSHLPGSEQAISRISVANTGILFHDGRALATCESGPPMRVALPGLETVGWFNGTAAEGEARVEDGPGFGGGGLLNFMREWTTAHPRVDPRTGELIAFHSAFAPPYVHYSIVPASHPPAVSTTPLEQPTRLFHAAVPGVGSPKMMHDFGVSRTRTVILDLPLSLDPLNLARGKPVVSYDPNGRSRFGVFPRYAPERVRWFETDPCCVFHTANTWDEGVEGADGALAVNMLSCRLTSASLVFSAGDIAIPEPPVPAQLLEEEQCRLYYHRFSLDGERGDGITHQFALSAIPFEFPSIRDDRSMSAARYIYGCSTTHGTFSAALGRAVKIDCLVKIDAQTLVDSGRADPSVPAVGGCVDRRTVTEILGSPRPDDPISIFRLPAGHYAQESRFVPRVDSRSEDDGYILTYVFNEDTELDPATGECRADARSELWIIDARNMETVVAKVYLPQRVPYGLHGNWFPERQILGQRPIERLRQRPGQADTASVGEKQPLLARAPRRDGNIVWRGWMATREGVERFIG